MLFPASNSCINVKMAQWTPISSRHRLSRHTFFLLHMNFIILLMNCFLASWTLFVVFAICTLPNQMGCECANLNSLSTLATYDKHGARVKVMHIFVILLGKPFINSFTELANMILVYLVCA